MFSYCSSSLILRRHAQGSLKVWLRETIVVVITACFCKNNFMAGKKNVWTVNFIRSPAIGRCGKKLVLGPGPK